MAFSISSPFSVQRLLAIEDAGAGFFSQFFDN